MVQEPKFCVNCGHHISVKGRSVYDIGWSEPCVFHYCRAPQARSLVTGEQEEGDCRAMRQPGKCGPEGAWYVGT